MSYSYKCYSDTKDFMKKFVNAEEGAIIYGISKSIVYEGNIETQEWLYYEQDGMVVTLGNWLNGRLSCEQIEQLWCELIIPEQNKEQKESEE